MTPLFSPIEPYETGMMEASDEQSIYWECCGNPDGEPALFLHGGPGSGASKSARRFFDPKRFRAVLFDQRGSGRSRPLVGSSDAELSANTTLHIIADIEQLRERLEVDRWTVLGISWGTTLGLAYAQMHPERIAGLVLALVTTTSRREVEWITRDVGRIFPVEWERFANAIPDGLRHMALVDAYATMLFDPDVTVRDRAALEWCAWEDTHVSLAPGFRRDKRFDDATFRLQFARLVTHYWRHAAFLEDEQLIRDAPILNGIPGILLNGRYDVSGPLEVAWRLSKTWNTSGLRILDIGHGDGEILPAAVIDALAQISPT